MAGHTASKLLCSLTRLSRLVGRSLEVLRPGGTLVVKIFNGSELHDYLSEVKTHFKAVKILKPDSSRTSPFPNTSVQHPSDFGDRRRVCVRS